MQFDFDTAQIQRMKTFFEHYTGKAGEYKDKKSFLFILSKDDHRKMPER
jgi:hypothetical protein